MTSRKPPSKLDRLLKSHLKLLRAFRHQTNELGELRKVILEMRKRTPDYYLNRTYEDWLRDQSEAKVHSEPMSPYEKSWREHLSLRLEPNDWPRL